MGLPDYNAVEFGGRGVADIRIPDALRPTPRVELEGSAPKPAKKVPLLAPLDKQVGGGHYKDLAIQPVQYIHANNIPFIEGNVIKYVTRWRSKGGIADLEKAKHFIELLIELEAKK